MFFLNGNLRKGGWRDRVLVRVLIAAARIECREGWRWRIQKKREDER
jgi:hypothetical protein